MPLIEPGFNQPRSERVRGQDSFAVLFRRILPAAVGLLPRLDLPRRAILHRQHNALVHYKRRPLPEPALPDEIRTQQDEEEGDTEDHLRLDPEHRDQLTSEPDVFEGEPLYFRTNYISDFRPR